MISVTLTACGGDYLTLNNSIISKYELLGHEMFLACLFHSIVSRKCFSNIKIVFKKKKGLRCSKTVVKFAQPTDIFMWYQKFWKNLFNKKYNVLFLSPVRFAELIFVIYVQCK